MKRDLEAMSAKTYDLVIVGGGITGACIARDASLRGLSVALVERRDFASATTSASSKLIHGGLRYLQNLELGLVRESLRERRLWSNTAPHMVDPLTFLMPITSRRIKDRLVRAIGLTLYDWLAYDRNRLDDPEKSIPAHKKLNRKEVLALEPGLASEGLTGAMIFYDYQMYSPERLALECILSAVEAGADAANYAEVVEFLRADGRVTGVRVRDHLGTGGASDGPDASEMPEHLVHGRLVVNAAGPWADILMGFLHKDKQGVPQPSKHLIRSKGIHVLTRSLTHGYAIAVPYEHGHFFILPWRGHSIIGTTDTVFKGDPDGVHVTEKDIINFLAVVNKGFPGAKLHRSDVLYFYCGLRPIVDQSTSEDEKEPASEPGAPKADEPDSYTASRASEIYDHEVEEGVPGILTVIGGKWTTSRNLAEKVVDLVLTKLDKPKAAGTTDHVPTYGGAVGRFTQYRQEAVLRHADLPAPLVENLAKNYGSHMEEVLALTQENPQLLEQLSDRFPDIAAEVVYAVRNEMAETLEDVLFRRTGLGTIGTPGDKAVNRVAEIMAQELNWDAAALARQVGQVIRHFTSWGRTRAIVNPHSYGDRTGTAWPAIERKLIHAIGPVEAVFTDGPSSATRLTRQALKDGMEQIIAVGGDGTINEVVNGFIENDRPINPDAVLAVLTSGTGRDFRRTFSIPDTVDDQIERLAASEIRSIDLGKLTFIGDSGKEEVRYFGNIASFGLSGATDRSVNELTHAKRFGGKFAFQWGMLKALLTYRNQPVRIRIDDAFDQVVNVSTVAVCNGQFFGSGMHIAPNAVPDDGLFDVVMIADIGIVSLLLNVGSIYKGEHLSKPSVSVIRGRRVIALPVEGAREVLLDVDGEAPGRLPATFEIIPTAICFRG